jgi:hypothetical protein
VHIECFTSLVISPKLAEMNTQAIHILSNTVQEFHRKPVFRWLLTAAFLLEKLSTEEPYLLLLPRQPGAWPWFEPHPCLFFQAAVASGTTSPAGTLRTLGTQSLCPAPKCSATSTATQVRRVGDACVRVFASESVFHFGNKKRGLTFFDNS